VGDACIDGIPQLHQTPVFSHQVRRTLRNCGLIDPTKIDHYLAQGGYTGLVKALEERTGAGKSCCYAALKKFDAHLEELDGLWRWKA
jgi:hypothetical protein